MGYSGNLTRAYAADRAAPIGRGQPWRHGDSTELVDRDDAPRGGGWQPATWDANPTPGLPASDQGFDQGDGYDLGHNDDSGHDVNTSSSHGKTRSAWLDYQRAELGTTHPPAGLDWAGAAGAAHGGLRGDSSAPWSNPDGFDLGHDPQPRNTVRRMGRWLTHAALRGAPRPRIETGTAGTGDPSGLGRFTSPYDPARDLRTWGVSTPTVRRILRPYGSTEFHSADEAPQTAWDAQPPIGGDFAL